MLGLASCIARTLHAAVLLLMFLHASSCHVFAENFVMQSPIFPQDCWDAFKCFLVENILKPDGQPGSLEAKA